MSSGDELFCLSLNHDVGPTIIFLHGLCSNHTEYAKVLPFLPGHHLLAVDLPGHSQSSHLLPITLPNAADQVTRVIKRHARDGRAHVVGSSLGGFVALQLAKRHPEVVDTLFVTGAAPFTGYRRWFAEHPNVLYCLQAPISKYSPGWVDKAICAWIGLQKPDGLREQERRNFSRQLLTDGFRSIARFTESDLSSVYVRTLTIAGETQDDVQATRNMGKLLREGCAESKAAIVRSGAHAWDLQFPQLFAKTVKAWIDGSDFPDGLEEIS
ncbi:uncharacterized protein A1O5_06115 [Cladophialophora psammophila CBS 110553]|uniref:AB hydrolase-1 domain-containing protein n=1 Tax=Cladophialophora psammophila CBS 110553 TaxID=1182543 RepID=W9WSD5_9EURO|nr:uncharacterized protein A1O5_06115 [Cladophialophora psammophila CBS 110553]EXJ71122.1 hypothetical protein A1O5_06115 [Cladophialophora psammophila CBS 110553]